MLTSVPRASMSHAEFQRGSSRVAPGCPVFCFWVLTGFFLFISFLATVSGFFCGSVFGLRQKVGDRELFSDAPSRLMRMPRSALASQRARKSRKANQKPGTRNERNVNEEMKKKVHESRGSAQVCQIKKIARSPSSTPHRCLSLNGLSSLFVFAGGRGCRYATNG